MLKNIFNKRMSLLMLLFVAVFSLSVTSCSDDDSDGGGQPEITGVRLPDPTKADSLFNKAGQGQIIAIIGKNLSHVMKVYINDQEVYFNPTMNTDHSVIVTVPSEKDGFKLSSFDSTIPDEIRVETTHGTAVYAFKITQPGPQLQRLEARYPRTAGDTMKLYGLNLLDIEKVYITDAMSEQLDTTKWTEVPGNHIAIDKYFDILQNHYQNQVTQAYQTQSVVGAVIPENAPDSGSVVMECASGTVYIPYYRMPGKPTLFAASSDMPEIGETLVLTGRDFVQIDKITYGDVTLTSDDYTVSSSEDTIYIPFKTKPSQGSGTTLTISNPAGSVSLNNFYDYTTLLTTFDNDDAVNNAWSPTCLIEDAGNADGNYARIFKEQEAQQWWGTMVYFRKDWNGNSFPLSENIPSNASADDVYLAMNVYDDGDYNNGSFWGYIRYIIQPIGDAENQYDNFGWESYDDQIGMFPDGPVVQDINGQAHKRQWYRAIVPLSKFACYKGQTYADIVRLGLNQFRFQSMNQSTSVGKVDIKFDNVRVIYIPKK